MKTILIICFSIFCTSANAQLGNRLKEKAREAAERKANQKVDEALNKGVNKIDSIITGKKREKSRGEIEIFKKVQRG